MTVLLEKREMGRRPLTLLAALVVVALLYIGATHGAPLFIWAIWGLAAVAIVDLVVFNPETAMLVTANAIHLTSRETVQVILLTDITRIEIASRPRGADAGTIHLRKGASVPIHAGALPPCRDLARALAPLHIPVLRDGVPVTGR
jgi:hypothetical protein